MLPLLTSVCEKMYRQRYGAICLSIIGDEIHCLFFPPSKDIHPKYHYNVSAFDQTLPLGSQLKNFLSCQASPNALLSVSLDAKHIAVNTLSVDQLPKKLNERDQFIRWRLGKECRQDLNQKSLSYDQIPKNKSGSEILLNVAITDDSIVTQVRAVANELRLCLQSLRANTLCLPIAVAWLTSKVEGAVFAILYVSKDSWCVGISTMAGESYYHRAREWLGHPIDAQQINTLVNDIVRVLTYFSSIDILMDKRLIMLGDHILFDEIMDALERQSIAIHPINVQAIVSERWGDFQVNDSGIVFPLAVSVMDRIVTMEVGQ
ncbi:MAG TPA: hypothetical protein DCR37_04120 [Glaciecola sp.]|nr:hypothetical protein [Glaciecola sp.]